MNKSRKLLALVLAMIMAFSLMAVTAAAYEAEDGHDHGCTVCCEDEGVMPLGPVPGPWCRYCGASLSPQEGPDGTIKYVCAFCSYSI